MADEKTKREMEFLVPLVGPTIMAKRVQVAQKTKLEISYNLSILILDL